MNRKKKKKKKNNNKNKISNVDEQRENV